ncbi:hypothetical protein CRE_06654 [Caenorhabditis remanei]|uniref:PAN-3 domain-containing protein n=1 Tax=Caenorhabditis remanei TaxID=31234 RepID=E3M200_CAERE|nr:hypothetical protein CRE_06654 [Caenorhabditis remanei]
MTVSSHLKDLLLATSLLDIFTFMFQSQLHKMLNLSSLAFVFIFCAVFIHCENLLDAVSGGGGVIGRPGQPGSDGQSSLSSTLIPPTGASVSTSSATSTPSSTLISITNRKPKYTKMIKFLGKVTQPAIDQSIVGEGNASVAECIQGCYKSGTCVIAYVDAKQQCRFFNYKPGITIIVEEAGEEVVAFKVRLTPKGFNSIYFQADLDVSSCPPLYKELSSDMMTGFSTMKWTKVDNGWVINM